MASEVRTEAAAEVADVFITGEVLQNVKLVTYEIEIKTSAMLADF